MSFTEVTHRQLSELIVSQQPQLLERWVAAQLSAPTLRPDLISEQELRQQSEEFLDLLTGALQHSGNLHAPAWAGVREQLGRVSRERALRGFTFSEVATFVFSFKQPLFDALQQRWGQDPEVLASVVWSASTLIDALGLQTVEIYQNTREAVIERQRQEMLELSTPVVTLWDEILALPLIGTLDSERTQIVMEALLQRIVEEGASIAIIDITGVPTVDTLVAQHLIKTVAAARLMGADCIISGIRPQIAQTIVHLGINLSDVTTKASLADAFAAALARTGMAVTRIVARG
ncbi:rsbT co-antagonist protein RsbR [Deinobacterium chartae]|uniref:RsbT co-antagonist protein RsbR n=1 Tax=Deinobacterium chartae TaxID=521158 RepID=A0A841I326_9DEIO|nr:STAS domain-containing protein [Deinobacterium chartae]MBB6098758.1 rsbT co-antagonist protein RsbR [Deinobacterium chartae]